MGVSLEQSTPFGAMEHHLGRVMEEFPCLIGTPVTFDGRSFWTYIDANFVVMLTPTSPGTSLESRELPIFSTEPIRLLTVPCAWGENKFQQ